MLGATGVQVTLLHSLGSGACVISLTQTQKLSLLNTHEEQNFSKGPKPQT